MTEFREHRVIGPPGTGKTTFLARQSKRAAQRFGGEEVVVASLTRAAAEEVAGRDTGIPKENVGTLHSHAFRALEYPKVAESKDGIGRWNEHISSKAPNLQINSRYTVDPENAPLEGGPTVATDGERLLMEVNVLRQRRAPIELSRQAVRAFAREWDEWKHKAGMIDFTDMIELALDDVDVLPQMPKVFMLDEAQDLSALEFALARKWGEQADQLVVVGDPFQNLYEWRGSDPDAFFDSEVETEHVLAQSYRVPVAVHAYAVEWAKPLTPEGHEFPAYEPRDEEGRVTVADEVTWEAPDDLVRLVQRDVDEGRTVMVLASCGYMLEPFQRALKAAGMPFHNPYRPTHGGWNPLRGARPLRCFLRPDPRTWGEEARMWNWDDLRRWTDPLTARGVLTRGSKTFIEAKCHEDQFGNSQSDTIPSFGNTFELFEEDVHEQVFEMDVDWWQKHLRARHAPRMVYPLEVYRRRGGAALLEEARITVGTIHSVKGGEADSVYVFPDLSGQGYWHDWRKPQRRGRIIRQFYVAFTRAREKLTLCKNASAEYVPLPLPE